MSKPTQNLRVAIVSDWYLPRFGGIETQLNGLAKALSGTGMHVEVFTPVPGPDEIEGVRVNRLTPGSGPKGGYRFPPSPVASNVKDFLYVLDLLARRGPSAPVNRLVSALKSGAFDLVHAQLGNTPFAYLAVNAAIAMGIPVVATFHSMLAPGEIPFAALGCMLLGCRGWQDRVVVTAVSSRVAAVRQPMIGTEAIKILPNGIDAAFWSAARAARRPAAGAGPIELVAAMRLHARKRPMALLFMMKALARRNLPTNGYRLRIAGDGPLRDRLTAQAKALGLGASVHFVGKLDRTGLADLLAKADLFLMPSYFESFGIAALEARMAGVPVLTMKTSGAWDFLTPQTDSLRADDDGDFVDALATFIGDPEVRKRLRNGSAEPLDGYDWQELTARALELYQTAIQKTAGHNARVEAT